MSGQTRLLLKGTAILATAALLTKLLGVIYRIPYQNITGNIGFYVYQQVYPLFSILLIMATAGFPIAISKMVSERLAVGDVGGAKRIFKVSVVALSVTGILFFFILYTSAPAIALWMAEDEQLILPIRSVSFALLVVPVMSALRGYYQGHQHMLPTAISQIVEQIVRVATILILSYWFMSNQYNEYYAGAGAVFGAFTGAVSAFVVLLFFWKQMERKRDHWDEQDKEKTVEQVELTSAVDGPIPEDVHPELLDSSKETLKSLDDKSNWHVAKMILYYAIPICLGALVLPMLQLVDAFTVARWLIHSGWEHEVARELKGIFDRGQPLIQFAAFFATALSLALVPSISEAHAKGDRRLIAVRSQIALKVTLLIGLAASLGLAILARPINIMLYMTDEGTLTLSVLAFTTIFSTLGLASAAILQGLGHVMLPARNLLFGVIVKLLLNILLIPWWSITGAAVATVLAYAVATSFNLVALYRLTDVHLSVKVFLAKPIAAVVIMSICVLGSLYGLPLVLGTQMDEGRIYFSIIALFSVGVGALSYGIALLRIGAVTRSDLEVIPKVQRAIPYLERLKIMKE